MDIVIKRGSELRGTLHSELARYRHRVFVRELGWELPDCGARAEEERDQFDAADTLYVIARHAEHGVCGCARLLPTTRPYLLSEVFSELAGAEGPPCSRTVWELSRFAARSHACGAKTGLDDARAVFAHALLAAQRQGAEQVVGVMSPAIERVCRMIGAHPTLLGAGRRMAGGRVLACRVELRNEQALLELARREERARRVLRHEGTARASLGVPLAAC
jgi:acyl homoserine lactone synthase